MSLPQDTSGGIGGGEFFKPVKGANKVLLVGEVVTGYEYWTADNKAVRSRVQFETTPGIRQVKKTQKDGTEIMVDDKQKFFWAVPVYNYTDKSIKMYQISQKGVRDALVALQANEDWGDPVGRYSITINKDGEGITGTKYSVTPNPVKEGDKVIAEAMALAASNPIDIEGILFGV